jgi:hypothetical protein
MSRDVRLSEFAARREFPRHTATRGELREAANL